MIVEKDRRAHGASKLVAYMSYDEGKPVAVRDSAGRDMSDEDVAEFVEESEEREFERSFQLNPDPKAEFSEQEVDRRTREFMADWRSERPTASYCYVIHEGETGKIHSHVAMTGEKDDMWIERDDYLSLSEQAAESFREPERLKQKEREKEAERDLEQEHARAAERSAERSRGWSDD